MSETKRQRRAEAVERLKNIPPMNTSEIRYVRAILGSVAGMTAQDVTRELIDLLTDDGANDDSAPESGVTDGDVDSREKLEADVLSESASWLHTPYGFRKVRNWLDRQADITRREVLCSPDERDEQIAELTAMLDEWKDLQKQVMGERNHAIAERDELRAECEGLEHANKRQSRKIHDVCEANSKLKAELDAYRGEYEDMEFIVSIDEAMKFTTDPPGYVKKALADLQARVDELAAERDDYREKLSRALDLAREMLRTNND